jgi:hypothetical protein
MRGLVAANGAIPARQPLLLFCSRRGRREHTVPVLHRRVAIVAYAAAQSSFCAQSSTPPRHGEQPARSTTAPPPPAAAELNSATGIYELFVSAEQSVPACRAVLKALSSSVSCDEQSGSWALSAQLLHEAGALSRAEPSEHSCYQGGWEQGRG